MQPRAKRRVQARLTSLRRLGLLAGTVAVVLATDVAVAVAQLVQSDVDAQPGGTETTQLVTSSTEVRRAVVGLLAVALVTGVMGILYWYKTGQLARERHTQRHGGRHGTGPQRPRPAAARPESAAPPIAATPGASRLRPQPRVERRAERPPLRAREFERPHPVGPPEYQQAPEGVHRRVEDGVHTQRFIGRD